MSFLHEEDMLQIGDTYYRLERDGDVWRLYKWGAESTVYRVTDWDCDCPAFKFRKDLGRVCKHVEAVREHFPDTRCQEPNEPAPSAEELPF